MTDYQRFRPLFEQALDPRFYNIEYLDSLVLSMRAQIWFSDNAAIVTEVKTYPSGATAICGVIAAGDLGEIVNVLIPKAEEWGRSLGCTFAMIESRQGWARQMKQHGYAPFQVSIVKEL